MMKKKKSIPTVLRDSAERPHEETKRDGSSPEKSEHFSRKFCPCCLAVVDVENGSSICPNCEFDFDSLTEEERRLADDPELGKKADNAQFFLHLISCIIAAVIMVAAAVLLTWLYRLIF